MRKIGFMILLAAVLCCVFGALASTMDKGYATLAVGDTIAVDVTPYTTYDYYEYEYEWTVTEGADCIQISIDPNQTVCTVKMLKAGNATLKCVTTRTREGYRGKIYTYYDYDYVYFTILPAERRNETLSGTVGDAPNVYHYMYSKDYLPADCVQYLSCEWEIVSGPIHFLTDSEEKIHTKTTIPSLFYEMVVLEAPGTAVVRATFWNEDYPDRKYIYTATIEIAPPDIPTKYTSDESVKMDYNHLVDHYIKDQLEGIVLVDYAWEVISGSQYVHLEYSNSYNVSIYGDYMGNAVIRGTATLHSRDYQYTYQYVHTINCEIEPPEYPEFLGTTTCTKCGGARGKDCTFCIFGRCWFCNGNGCSICHNGKCTICNGKQWIVCSKCEGLGTQTPDPVPSVEWNAPVYTWSSDNAQVTATRTGKNDASLRETETVNASGSVIKAAACTNKGSMKYTSSAFKNTAFTVQTKTVETPALGHEWSEITYTWANEPLTVTAKRACNRSCGLEESEKISAQKQIFSPGEKTIGAIVYTSQAFTNTVFTAQTKTVVIPALNQMHVLRLPAKMNSIGVEAFANLPCEAVIIPEGCKSIGSRAFANCRDLVYVLIPASVTVIAADAFAGCDRVIIDRIKK